MSKKLCLEAGCINIIDKSERYCSKHQKDNQTTERVKDYDKNRRNQDNKDFYNSTQWRKLSKLHRSKNPLCEMCGVVGNQVDHIKEIEDGGCKLCYDNLQTLCESCHRFKTVQEAKMRKREKEQGLR